MYRSVVFSLTGEIPMLMILEYFYVERPLGSDGFFDNRLIAANNILTTLEIGRLTLASPAINMVVDNMVSWKFKSSTEDEPPGGFLDLINLLIIIVNFCIATAAIVRLVVNSKQNLNWDENLMKDMMEGSGCLEFNYRNSEVFLSIDIIYLVLCFIPLTSLVFVLWDSFAESSILSEFLIFANESADEPQFTHLELGNQLENIASHFELGNQLENIYPIISRNR